MSTDQYLIQNLNTAIKANDPAEIQRTFVAYLKGGAMPIPMTSLEDLKGGASKQDLIDYFCPVRANKCADLIKKFINTDGEIQDEGVQILKEMIETGEVINDSTNVELIKELLRFLGIDYKIKNPIDNWLKKVYNTDTSPKKAAYEKIANNFALHKILWSFLAIVNNPTATTHQLLEWKRNAQKNPEGFPVPFRKCRGRKEKPIFDFNEIPKRKTKDMTGGGQEEVDERVDTYDIYIDQLSEKIEMLGGANELSYSDIITHINNLLNEFNELLKKDNRKLHPDDENKMKQDMEDLKKMEGRINQYVKYLKRYEQLKEDDGNILDTTKLNNFLSGKGKTTMLTGADGFDQITGEIMKELLDNYTMTKKKFVSKLSKYVSILKQLDELLRPGPRPYTDSKGVFHKDTVKERQDKISDFIKTQFLKYKP